MTATETPNGSALAVREMSDDQLRRRIELNRDSRFGLQEASPAQLNTVFFLARRWGLDPINEITLFEGHPFITLDGRLQVMRRNPEYLGYRTRPLNKDEKEAWGYEPDDLVVECTVRTRSFGDITERGCVRRQEIDRARQSAAQSGRKAAPVGIYSPEIAEKRAIARASRAAFGEDVPDEDDAISAELEERSNVPLIREGAATYDRVFGPENEQSYVDRATAEVFEDRVAAPPAAPQGRDEDSPSSSRRPIPAPESVQTTLPTEDEVNELGENAARVEDARQLGVVGVDRLVAKRGWSLERIRSANAELAERIRSHEAF